MNNRKKVLTGLVAVLVIATSVCMVVLSNKSEANQNAKKNFKVVAYYPYWKGNQLRKLQFNKVTHVNYAFAIPTREGNLRKLEQEELAKQLIKEAHKQKVKVLLSVGGWSYNDAELEPVFKEATNTEKKRAKLAKSIINMCNKYGFDGIDMDWEHPRTDTTKNQYEAFMLYLGKKLHSQDKLFTAAILGGVNQLGAAYYDSKAQTDKVLNELDWINVMAYDGGDGRYHSPYSYAKKCGNYWKKKRGVPAGKIVLGVPFYGRPTWATYEELLEADKNAYKSDTATFNGTKVYYNGVNTIKKKTNYALDNFGGVMIWEITQDSSNGKYSLLNAIYSCLK